MFNPLPFQQDTKKGIIQLERVNNNDIGVKTNLT